MPNLFCKAFNNNIEKIRNASVEELIEIDGIGEIMALNSVSILQTKTISKSLTTLINNYKES